MLETNTTIPIVPLPPRKSYWKKIVLALFIILILIIGGVGFFFRHLFFQYGGADIAPIDDSDLRLKKVSVSDTENAYYDLVKLDRVLFEPEGTTTLADMSSGKTWDDAVAKDIISSNTEALGYFAEAANKPKFQDSAIADPATITPNTALPALNTWRKMARVSAIHALYLARQGKDLEAIDEALTSVKIGQKIQDSQNSSIEYLVGQAMKGTGLETIQRIIATSKLNTDTLRKYAQELDVFYRNEDGLITAFKGEYFMGSFVLRGLMSGNPEVSQLLIENLNGDKTTQKEIAEKIKNSYSFEPNKTQALFADLYRSYIKNVSMPCGEIKTPEKLVDVNSPGVYAEENVIGKILYDVVATSFTKMVPKKCQEDLLVGATQTLIAIKAYQNDNKKYPAALTALVPNYLSSVPQDPFDGKQLKYSAQKKILYSVGQDMQDNGGSTGDDWRIMPNPTFKIDF